MLFSYGRSLDPDESCWPIMLSVNSSSDRNITYKDVSDIEMTTAKWNFLFY